MSANSSEQSNLTQSTTDAPLSTSFSAGESPQVPDRRLALLGVAIDNVTMEQTISMVERFIATGGYHQIATANVDFLHKAIADAELKTILNRCALTIADGMPLVWASKPLGFPLAERVTGVDLVQQLIGLSAEKGYRVFLLGATPERSQAAWEEIQQRYPQAVVCGRLSPTFAPLSQMDHESILREIEVARADILLVAFGNPKQEKWLAMHRDRLKVPVCIGVGASLDFLSGRQPRAPHWMQRSGLEWLHRLATEPRRLWRRYFGNAMFTVRHVSGQVLANYLQKRHATGYSIVRSQQKNMFKVEGDLTRDAIEQIRREVDIHRSRDSLTLDLSACTFVSAEALGWMLGLSNLLTKRGTTLRLVAVSKHVLRAIRSAFPGGAPFALLQEASSNIISGGVTRVLSRASEES